MQQQACEKVYYGRIQRGQEAYSVKKLGALGSDLGAIACYFEQAWSRVSPALPKADRVAFLNNASFILQGLGRLTDALEPLRAALDMAIHQAHWNQERGKNAATLAANLSGLELILGKVDLAVEDAKLSVICAERSGDAFKRADALHQAGRRDEAAALFREAENMQADSRPEKLVLYSVAGFRYCDLLLAAAERAAWRCTLQSSRVPQPSSLPESCLAVAERAAQTIKVAESNNWLLDIALDHLTLGRAALYAAILEGIPLDQLDPCRESLQHAVASLRQAGMQQYLPHCLLTHAWLRCLTGARASPESAQSDLDEAWEIAERGPMPLFMADIHLHRARLFGLSQDRPASYPWTSPQHDLAEARRLIEKHGYGRRKVELEDAEAAARAVQDSP
jgi:tetratricopeptide (TPR) repeat protein